MFGVHYKGIPIRTATKSAFMELAKLDMDFFDVKAVLEHGFDCARSRRKKDIEERCVRKGRKVLKVVVELKENEIGERYWRIRHAGMFGYKKGRFKMEV